LAHDVYIGYSKFDKATAEAVCHRLEGAGIRCWIAPRDIGDDRSQDDAIVQALGESKLAVTVFSPPANASRHVLNAVAAALDAEITVIPFRVEDIQSPGQMPSPRLHWLDVLSEPLDARIRRLIDRVNSQLSGLKDRDVALKEVI
jgi:hypothetical protein